MEARVDNATRQLLGELRRKAIEACTAPGGGVALLDAPLHSNSGDAAIYWGELTAIRHGQAGLAYTCTDGTYDARALRSALTPGGAVFLHGGGNFGSIWPENNRFRNGLLEDLKEFSVTLLPQTANFPGDIVDDQTKRAFASHPACKVFARDARTHRVLTGQLDCQVELAPDMAFAMGITTRPRQPSIPILWLARQDREAVSPYQPVSDPRVRVVDWPATEGKTSRLRMLPTYALKFGVEAAGRLSTERFDRPAVGRVLIAEATRLRLARGRRILSAGEVVITDRLHGHILSTLMGIPNVVIDNGYGKVSEFIKTWTSAVPYVRLAESPDEAFEVAKQFL